MVEQNNLNNYNQVYKESIRGEDFLCTKRFLEIRLWKKCCFFYL